MPTALDIFVLQLHALKALDDYKGSNKERMMGSLYQSMETYVPLLSYEDKEEIRKLCEEIDLKNPLDEAKFIFDGEEVEISFDHSFEETPPDFY